MSENTTKSVGVGTQSNLLSGGDGSVCPSHSNTSNVSDTSSTSDSVIHLKSKIRPGNIDTCRSCLGSLTFKHTILNPFEPQSPVLDGLLGIPHDFMSSKYLYRKRGVFLHRLISAELGNFKLPYPVPGSEAILEALYAKNPSAKKIVRSCCDYAEDNFLKDTSQDFYIEELLGCLKDYHIEGFYGRCDAALVSKDTAEIIDFKTGLESVSPEESLQLLCYAAGIRAKHPDIRNFMLTILQPDKTFEYTPSSYFLTSDELDMRIRQEVIPLVLRCEADELAFKTGEHCSKCPHLFKCTAGLQCHLVPIFKEIEANIVSGAELGTEDFIPFIHLRSVINSSYDEWRDRLITAYNSGAIFPNLQFKKSTKEVYYDENTVSAKLRALNLDPYTHILKSPKDIKKELGEPAYTQIIAPYVHDVHYSTSVYYRS